MSKSNENIFEPKLRFPEFVKEGEWGIKELSELGDLINGLTYSPSDVREKGLLVLRSSNIQNGLIDLKDCVYVRTDIKGANLSESNDILVCVRNGSKNLIGKNAIIPKGIPLSTHGAFMTVFRAKNSEFVFQLFQTDFYDIQVKADLGATINSINGKNFLKYEFPIPENTKEQQKIASCLSSLDEVITTENQKLEVLKVHKQGLLQNLFPQEGKTVPKMRFKEFEGSVEWGSNVIGDFVESHIGGAPLTPSDFVQYSEFEVIPKKAITEGVWLNLDVRSPTYCTERFYNKNPQSIIDSTYLVTTLRDLVPSGPSVGYIVKYSGAKKYILAQGVYGIKLKQALIPEFLVHFSNTKLYRKLVNAAMVGSTQVHIRNSVFFNLPIKVPIKQEQQKIATCLSTIDDLINTQSQKVEALKFHKKGLLQGLFPDVNPSNSMELESGRN